MKSLLQSVRKWDFWKDEQGQDLIEYALMAGFVALAAATVLPTVTTKLSTIFSKIQSELTGAGG